ncbi:MAG: 2TM domain-containing protein, partial [bacterium]
MDLLESYKKAYRELVIQENKTGFIHHLLSYICFNIIFTLINLLYAKEAIWFFWPIVIWGIIGIIPHYLYSVRWIEREIRNMEIIA